MRQTSAVRPARRPRKPSAAIEAGGLRVLPYASEWCGLRVNPYVSACFLCNSYPVVAASSASPVAGVFRPDKCRFFIRHFSVEKIIVINRLRRFARSLVMTLWYLVTTA